MKTIDTFEHRVLKEINFTIGAVLDAMPPKH